MQKMNKKGFTLIELLVVIAIIGLLSTLAVVALNSARQKSRDSKRVADVKQIQTALELFFSDSTAGYPAGSNITLGINSAKALCDGGWNTGSCAGTTYMGLVPTAPTPAETGCTTGQNSYEYLSPVGVDAGQYSIKFCLGNKVGDLGAGPRTADPNGIK